MDPLSATGSVIGVLSLTLNATKTTYSLIQGVKNPPKSHEELLRILVELRTLLRALESGIPSGKLEVRVETQTLLMEIAHIIQDVTRKLQAAQSESRWRRLTKARPLDMEVRSLSAALLRLNTLVLSMTVGEGSDIMESIRQGTAELDKLMSLRHEELVKSIRSTDIMIQSANMLAPADSKRTPEKTISSLSQVDYESKHFFHKGQRPNGSGIWILTDRDFNRWVNGSKLTGPTNWLWLNGYGGSGKTTLTSIVIDHLLSKFRDDGTVAIAFFYFDYMASVTIPEIVATLIKQLCLCLPSPVIIPEEVIRVCEFIVNDRVPNLTTLLDALSAICFKFKRTFLILDGLDEYSGDGLSKLLQMLRDIPCKIFAASRRSEEFKKLFEESMQISTHVDENDITMYTSQTIQDHPEIRGLIDDKLLEEINRSFVRNADNMFLLPVLQMQTIVEQTTTWEIRQCLNSMSNNLAGMYDQAIQRLSLQSLSRSTLARNVLLWLAYAKRSLSIQELQHALALAGSSSDKDIDQEKIPPQNVVEGVCLGLVAVDPRSSSVLLSHFSLQSYLQESRDRLFPKAAQRNLLALTCLEYLHLDSFQSGPTKTAEELDERLTSYPFIRYAAVYWGDHLRESNLLPHPRVSRLLRNPLALSAISQIFLAEEQLPIFNANRLKQFSIVHWVAYFGFDAELRSILDHGTDHSDLVNDQDPLGRTPLHWAVERRHEKVTQMLLGDDTLFISDRRKTNVLHLAAGNNSVSMLNILLGHCKAEDLLCKDAKDQTPLQIAAGHGFFQAVAVIMNCMENSPLLRGKELDSAFKGALDSAVSNGRTEIVQVLLQKTESDARDLRMAAKYGFEDVVRILFEHGADLEAKDSRGVTAVHEASAAGRIGMILFLLENGVNVDLTDSDGRTPLFYAIEKSNRVVVELLLSQGADPNSSSSREHLAICRAAEIGNVDVLTVLLHRGAQPNPFLVQPNPLSLAVANGNDDAVRVLIDYGALINADEYQESPLHSAASQNSPATLKLLLERGARVDAKGVNGRTPLHTAAAEGISENIRLLLSSRADVNARDTEEFTPLMIAVRHKHADVANMLLEYGADPSLENHRGDSAAQLAWHEGLTELADTLMVGRTSLEGRSRNTRGISVGVGIHYEDNTLQACFGTMGKSESIKIVTWPDPHGQNRTATRVPTRIAYPEANDGKIGSIRWGYEVQPELFGCSCSKSLLLEGDDSLSQLLKGSKPPEDLCTDFLSEIFLHLEETLDHALPFDTVRYATITYCFTVCISPFDDIRSFQRVIRQAGFGTGLNDSVTFVTQGEAAALAIFDQLGNTLEQKIASGDSITICQCGDSTVDLTSYTLVAQSPELKFKETCASSGASFGFNDLQQAFERWMHSKFGDAYTSVPIARRGPGSRFARDFKMLKYDFDEHRSFELTLPMSFESNEYYDQDTGAISISAFDVKRLFDPVISRICILINDQVRLAEQSAFVKTQMVFVTGSFGDCKYMMGQVQNHFRSRHITLIFPPKGGNMATIGSALHAMESGPQALRASTIGSRVSRAHYGVQSAVVFDDGNHDIHRMFLEPRTMQKLALEIEWFLLKGEEITDSSIVRRVRMSSQFNLSQRTIVLPIEICTSSSDSPPLATGTETIDLVKIECRIDMAELAGTRTSKGVVDSSGDRYIRLDYELEVTVTAEDTPIAFAVDVIVEGRKFKARPALR